MADPNPSISSGKGPSKRARKLKTVDMDNLNDKAFVLVIVVCFVYGVFFGIVISISAQDLILLVSSSAHDLILPVSYPLATSFFLCLHPLATSLL